MTLEQALCSVREQANGEVWLQDTLSGEVRSLEGWLARASLEREPRSTGFSVSDYGHVFYSDQREVKGRTVTRTWRYHRRVSRIGRPFAQLVWLLSGFFGGDL